ncbi:Lrp/AsnC ligand binding domain-containing protein [Aliiroseovarius sediminis]|uniref:Lrp/AsnC ligand binding domain-containing protein n=1 Tax=Aliiroseovarius sediminis TaxID=2925839 RepID=UPI001F560D04|nr:Lrp/AsnC ligand binding domain-containing protein [uncultured Aliiroseovarius sp.]MCI2395340.1 Lrp/AsnC ligand binding domain-containing protein [Aliiroseovarius sediminis]
MKIRSAPALTRFERDVSRIQEVMECHLMSGNRDIVLRVVVADLSTFDRFMKANLMLVAGIRRMRSSFIFRTMLK